MPFLFFDITLAKPANLLEANTTPKHTHMNNLEYQTELQEILNILRDASNRANRIAESTQNPSQVTLDTLAEQIRLARQRLAVLIQD